MRNLRAMDGSIYACLIAKCCRCGYQSSMASSEYRTAPLATNRLPPGIAFIIGNEAAERFSYYGMRAILMVFMTSYLLHPDGSSAGMDEDQAKGWFHLFVSGRKSVHECCELLYSQ